MEKQELKELLMDIVSAYIDLDEKVSDKQIAQEIISQLVKMYDL